MEFISTRGKSFAKNASEAIVQGIAEDGGLFVPKTFPSLVDSFDKLLNADYAERAAIILSTFLEEYDYNGLYEACKKAYGKFDGDPAPLVKIDDNLYVLELFHGPTLAFKDIALTLLPYLLREGANNIGMTDEILILVATSGDTGKAALEGFKDQNGIKIMTFYPDEGVSLMQKLQMTTTTGENVNVVAVKGNFDDCQTAVKRIFTDEEFKKILKEKGVRFSSANSMNFGRLCPQIVYYFSAYFDMVNAGEIAMGQQANFVVPTGNFGNILAGYYAYKMGLPVGKLICASNVNNILTDFITTGEYNTNREFFKTTSPSMDILISSNLERLIFEVANRDAVVTKERMQNLSSFGKYVISEKERNTINEMFYAGCSNEEEVAEVIKNFYEEYSYVLDTHTAVAVGVAEDYANENNDENPIVVLSTASAYKFAVDVYRDLTGKKLSDATKACDKIEELSAVPVPEQIRELSNLEVRFTKTAESNELKSLVLEFAEK